MSHGLNLQRTKAFGIEDGMRKLLIALALSLTLVAPVAAQDTENRSWTTTWLSAVSADETTSTAMPTNAFVNFAVYAEWGAGTNAGVITIEEAYDPTYTGVWSEIGTITWSAASSTDVFHQRGAFRALRVRVSTAVGGGGTVTVRAIARPAGQ